jgi:hypothetical protein
LVSGDTRDLPAQTEEVGTYAPFAKAIAETSFKDAACTIDLHSVIIGGSRATSLRLGTFAVGDAIRDLNLSKPVCGQSSHVGETSSRESFWTALPTHFSKFSSSLVVFAFDETSLIPSRYDSYLPMPSDEIRSHLEKSEGVIAVRQRLNAPPVILMAAPRFAQLESLEEKLAAMTSIPTQPVIMSFEAKLLPSEIRTVVRSAYRAIRVCYEATLSENPHNHGRATLRFSILADGKVGEHRIELDDTLKGRNIQTCLDEALGHLVFPLVRGREGHEPTTVVYPVVFSPN